MIRFAILTVLLFISGTCVAQSPSPIGEWANYMNGGAEVSEGGQCLARKIEERRYSILPDSGGGHPNGVYATIWHIRWIKRESDTCSFSGLPPKPNYIGIRTWLVDVTPRAGSYDARAKYQQCKGDICGIPGLLTADFETTLTVADGRLRDAASDTADLPPMIFTDVTDTKRLTLLIANTFLQAWRKMPEGPDAVRYVSDMIAPGTFADEVIEARVLRNYRLARLQESAGYSIVEAYKLERGPKSWPANTDVMFITVANQLLDGKMVSETFELCLSDGAWKLLNLQW